MPATSPYSVRSMTLADVSQVAEIEKEAFADLWPQTTFRRELLQNKLARYLVAIMSCQEPLPSQTVPAQPPLAHLRKLIPQLIGKREAPPTSDLILGYVGLWLMVGEAHIVSLAVRESHRRQGVGETLLVAALELAQQEGQEVATLEYRISNRAAQTLYAKFGFRRVGTRPRYYSDNGEDAVIMTTESLNSPAFQELLARQKQAHQERWGAISSSPAQDAVS